MIGIFECTIAIQKHILFIRTVVDFYLPKKENEKK